MHQISSDKQINWSKRKVYSTEIKKNKLQTALLHKNLGTWFISYWCTFLVRNSCKKILPLSDHFSLIPERCSGRNGWTSQDTTFGLHSSPGNQFLVFYFICLYTWLLLRRFFPHQLFLLQGYPRPGGECFQTQTGHRTYTNPSSLELSSENIYITTTKRLKKRSLYAISLSGSSSEERSCQGDLSAWSWGMIAKDRVCRKMPASSTKRRSVPSKWGEGWTGAREQEKIVRCQVPTPPAGTGSTARNPPKLWT